MVAKHGTIPLFFYVLEEFLRVVKQKRSNHLTKWKNILTDNEIIYLVLKCMTSSTDNFCGVVVK